MVSKLASTLGTGTEATEVGTGYVPGGNVVDYTDYVNHSMVSTYSEPGEAAGTSALYYDVELRV